MPKELLSGIETLALEAAFQVGRGCCLEVIICDDGVTMDISNVLILKTLMGAASVTGPDDRIVEVVFVTHYGEMVISVEHRGDVAVYAFWVWNPSDSANPSVGGSWHAEPVISRCPNCDWQDSVPQQFHRDKCLTCGQGDLEIIQV